MEIKIISFTQQPNFCLTPGVKLFYLSIYAASNSLLVIIFEKKQTN